MVLNALYVCLLHSRFVEHHPMWILEDGPLISEAVLSQNGIRARLGLNTHSKHLKIATMFTMRTLSPYKYYSGLLRWQANIIVHIHLWNCINEGMR
jgi:hypothetical protein